MKPNLHLEREPSPDSGSWTSGLLPAEHSALSAGERMRQRLLVVFGLLVGALVLPALVLVFIRDPVLRLPRAAMLAIAAVITATPLWLRIASTRNVALTTIFVLHAGFFLIVGMNLGLAGPAAALLVCLPVITTVLLGPRVGWLDAVLVLALALAFEYLSRARGLPSTAPAEIWPLVRLTTLFVAVALSVLSITAYARLSRQQARELRRLAHHDRLTGLANRHYVAEIMPSELARLSRRREREGRIASGQPSLGLVLVDLDHFKLVNDNWSHSVGDRVLSAVAGVLLAATREGDVVARWGGEEFLIVLRDLEQDGLAETPARILEAVRRLRLTLDTGQRLRLTCSLGFTHVPPGGASGDSWHDLVELADAAMIRAKREGRDRGIGYLWAHDRTSDEELRRTVSEIPQALADGRLERVEVLPRLGRSEVAQLGLRLPTAG